MPTEKNDFAPVIPMRERVEKKLDAITAIRDQIRMQLNGVENQIYILNQLLNPDPSPEESSEDAPPLPEGTI